MGNVRTSNQQDSFNAQTKLNDKSGQILKDMHKLTEDAQGTTDSAKLQQIQLKMGDLQRDLDVMKQMEEKLAKAMETINKFVQAN